MAILSEGTNGSYQYSLAFGLSVDLASIVLAGAPTDARAEPVGMLAVEIPWPDTGFLGSMLIVRRVQDN